MNSIQEKLKGELTSNEVIESIFNALENNLMDGKKADLDFKNVIFINVHFLEKLEKLVQKAKELNIEITIKNVTPSIYKVFHVARDKDIISVVS